MTGPSCTIFVVCYLCTVASGVGSGSVHNNLVDLVLDRYDSRLLPNAGPYGTVNVTISMALRMVVELNAKHQVLTTSVWIRKRWEDDRLVWNPPDHNDTKKLIIPHDQIWKPDFILYDNTDFDYRAKIQDMFATVWANGTVSLVYPALFKSSCQINIYFFPFDQQTCHMRFSSWTYDKTLLVFELDRERVADTSYYQFNSEWLLTEFSAKTHEDYVHDCCDEPMLDVTWQLTLRRRYIMLFYYLYFPNILINIIATFQFLLPCDSTEKVTLGITILLAMIVYLLLIQEMLPQTEVVPIIVQYMSITLGLVTASLLITIVVLEVHHNGKHDNHSQLPHWARKYLLHGLARLLRMDKYITSDLERDHMLFKDTMEHLAVLDDSDYEMQQKEWRTVQHKADTTENSQNTVSNFLAVPTLWKSPSDSSRKNQSLLSQLTTKKELMLWRMMKYFEDVSNKSHIEDRELELACEWQELAMLLDRFFFILNILTITGVWVFCFISNPSYTGESVL